jgi:hypothetical protein
MLGLQCTIALLGLAGLLLARGRGLPRLLFLITVPAYVLTLGIARYSMTLMPFLIPFGAALALDKGARLIDLLRAKLRPLA